jgi:hypothetical protein
LCKPNTTRALKKFKALILFTHTEKLTFTLSSKSLSGINNKIWGAIIKKSEICKKRRIGIVYRTVEINITGVFD